jgi:LysM repeat protein
MPVIISASQPTPVPDISAAEPAAEQAPEPETYQVQRGEYLIQLAERFSMDWRELAQINAIGYPYVIYPGQIIKLR